MPSFPPARLQHKLAIINVQERRLSRVALWRSGLMIGCVLGLGLLATSPYWQIKRQSQIHLLDRELVNPDTIYTTLDFTYPQFIWAIDGLELTRKIESIPSIEAARIDKQIIPPKLTIHLQERIPVAIATSLEEVGFLDIDGAWIPQNLYTNVESSFSLPKLTVLNYQLQYQQSWIKIYQLISLYPELKIDEVQWNYSGNLWLQTKIGRVLIGTDSSRLEQQFKIMSKLQNLPQQMDRDKIAYVDLSNPQINLIQKY